MQASYLTLPDGRPASYIRLLYFSSDATQAIARLLRQGEQEGVAGYVVDLRNDPGGCPWRGGGGGGG